MMPTGMAEQLLYECQAIRTGHFVLSSGAHSDMFVAKSEVTVFPGITIALADEMANRLYDDKIEVVVAPVIGAVVIGFAVAYHLNQLRPGSTVYSVYAEKDGDGFSLNRGYDRLVRNRRVSIVEDIITSGDTVKRVIECVQRSGGRVTAVGCLWNRAGTTAEKLGVESFTALVDRALSKWSATPDDPCPLCRDGVPVNTELGHGAEFIARLSA
ncbi:MAG: phosphoribosyltransferase [Candidatus Kerfeldbacteria bacterium]|nr:phosphoribosyltransferase [Candidatus Kerfeldbacteria bacterium]